MIQVENISRKVKKELEGKYGEVKGVLSTSKTIELNKPIAKNLKAITVSQEGQGLELENKAKLEMFKRSFKYQYRDLIQDKVEVIDVVNVNPKAVNKAIKKHFRKKLFSKDFKYSKGLIVNLHGTQNVAYLELIGIKENKLGWYLPEYAFSNKERIVG